MPNANAPDIGESADTTVTSAVEQPSRKVLQRVGDWQHIRWTQIFGMVGVLAVAVTAGAEGLRRQPIKASGYSQRVQSAAEDRESADNSRITRALETFSTDHPEILAKYGITPKEAQQRIWNMQDVSKNPAALNRSEFWDSVEEAIPGLRKSREKAHLQWRKNVDRIRSQERQDATRPMDLA